MAFNEDKISSTLNSNVVFRKEFQFDRNDFEFDNSKVINNRLELDVKKEKFLVSIENWILANEGFRRSIVNLGKCNSWQQHNLGK